MFSESPSFFVNFFLKSWGFDYAPACGSPASVTVHIMTSQDYIKVKQVRSWLLSSSLAKFQQFESECFFQFCFSLFLLGYMVLVQFLPLVSCGTFVLFTVPRREFLIFFWSEIFKRLLDETHVFERSFVFCIYFKWWSFEFAPARNRTVIVSYHVTDGCD